MQVTPHPTPTAVHLSPPAEARLVFWSSPPDSMHSPATVAAVLDVAENTLNNWRTLGEGPAHVKRGGRVYYRASEVRSYLRGEK